ncbi:MAG TPA: PH domain-containing protein [Thermomicrobiales bacterium]|nr:PH domain-containing protein [Thermomicrobiales bacterium]
MRASNHGLMQPREKLDPRAKRVWMLGDLFGAVVFGLVAFAIAFVARWVFELHWAWVVVATGVVLALSLTWAIVSPSIRYEQWRFEIREDEVDLLHGLVVRTRQIVPMSRIQHVDTTRGPIQRRYGLASVVFYTAAGGMTIPELSDERAASVRDQIAALAKVHDDL